MLTIFDKRSWGRFLSMFNRGRKIAKIQKLWLGAMPLEDISNINEFSGWISNQNTKGIR